MSRYGLCYSSYVTLCLSWIQILEAYELGSSTLSTILKNPLLSLERINQTTDSLAEAMASQEEVDAAVRAVGGVTAGVDEDELENELRTLVEEEEKAQIRADQKISEQRSLEVKAREDAKKEEARENAEQKAREDAEKESKEEPAERGSLEPQQLRVEAMDRTKQEERPGEWEERYASAQQRQQEEKQRAEVERLRKDERRLAAD